MPVNVYSYSGHGRDSMGKRGPPDLGKTATIKRRRIDVYLPTLEAKERWNAAAIGRHQKVSEMVFELVETALAPRPAEDGAPPLVMAQRLDEVEAELSAQRQRGGELELLKESLERELEAYRAQDVLDVPRVPKVDSRIVRVFSQARGRDGRARTVEIAELRKVLRLTPKHEAELKALNVALEHMELHGWIRRSGRGWVWVGA